MGTELKVIVFSLADEQYAVEVEMVKTIERMVPITRVPKTMPFVKGIIHLRGVIIPVIDLRERFGMPHTEISDETRIIIVNMNKMEVGLIVDAANDIIDFNQDDIRTPPEIVGGVRAKYLRGVATLEDHRLLVLLNLQEVLNKEEIMQLEHIGE